MHEPAEDVGAHVEADARAQSQHGGPEERRKHLHEYGILVVYHRETSPVEISTGRPFVILTAEGGVCTSLLSCTTSWIVALNDSACDAVDASCCCTSCKRAPVTVPLDSSGLPLPYLLDLGGSQSESLGVGGELALVLVAQCDGVCGAHLRLR